MDVKQAVAKAKDYLSTVFADEQISDVRLEEVEFDRPDDAWLVTLGLLHRKSPQDRNSILTEFASREDKRIYKLVRIPNDEREIPSIKIR